MRTIPRHHEILRQLYLAGYVEVKELARTLEVDQSTIRRDLDALAEEGLVHRTHGGARPPVGAMDLPYQVKEGERLVAKRAIASAAAGLIGDGSSVVLDAGSTTYHLATFLRDRQGLTIVTHDVLIAKVAADLPSVRLIVVGGELLHGTYTLVGDRALSALRELQVDWAFLGADAVHPVAGVTNTNTLEIPLKRAMIEMASQRVLLADSSKFGRRALARVAGIDEFDRILTDMGMSDVTWDSYGDRVERVPLPQEGPDDPPVPGLDQGGRAASIEGLPALVTTDVR